MTRAAFSPAQLAERARQAHDEITIIVGNALKRRRMTCDELLTVISLNASAADACRRIAEAASEPAE